MIAGDDSALSQLRNETVDHALVSKTLSAKALLNALPEDRRSTPVLVVDLSVVEQDFREFLSSFPGTRVLYAVKANPDPDVLSRLARLGADFEISSVGELRLLMRLGISGERIISSNPVKTEELITQAHRIGVSHFAFDSEDEVEKIAACAPGAGLSVRLTVPNTGSDWPLDRKYGVKMDDAVHLLEYARGKGLDPSGVTFHVGSQCRSLDSWTYALGEAKQLWERCLAVGIRLDVINVGGGMPVVYGGQDAPSITAIGDAILKAKAEAVPPRRPFLGRARTCRHRPRWYDALLRHRLRPAKRDPVALRRRRHLPWAHGSDGGDQLSVSYRCGWAASPLYPRRPIVRQCGYHRGEGDAAQLEEWGHARDPSRRSLHDRLRI